MPNFNEYIKICKEAVNNEEVFNNFKTHPEYYSILEHVDNETGEKIFNYLLNKNKDLVSRELLNKFTSKDLIGSPRHLLQIDGLRVSPTTLRYIKILDDIITYFNYSKINKIAEIGAGYGGQAKIIIDYLKDVEYSCIDLQETHGLIQKYMHDYNLQTFDINSIPNTQWDICISNYAFSECPIEIQEQYFNKIILNSKMGYFTMNYISHLFNVISYTKEEFLNKLEKNNFNFSIFDEFPKTHPNNCLIVFNKKGA